MYRGKVNFETTGSYSQISELPRSKVDSQPETIQRQIEIYTRKLEEEKKRLFRVQQNHKEAMEEYHNQQAELQKLKTKKSKTELGSLSSKLKTLENSLEKGIGSFNEALSKNNQLKIEIDELRKERKNQMDTFHNLNRQIETINASMAQLDKNSQHKKEKVEDYKNQIMAIKQKNEKDQQYCQDQVRGMESSLKSQSNWREETMKKINKKQTETSDTQPIMKLRLKNIIQSNKEKMRIIEQYRKNMERIATSFEEIKEQSGINDLTEITSIFLKQEEQSIFILQFINKLTTELETIREHNQKLKNRIKNKQTENDQHRLELSGTPEQKRREQQIRKFIQQKNAPVKKTNRFLEQIQAPLFQLLSVSQNQMLTVFNIEEYLAQFQQLINSKCLENKANKKQSTEDIQLKQQFTKYSRVVPAVLMQEIKERADQGLLEEDRLREYATEFWEKKKNARA